MPSPNAPIPVHTLEEWAHLDWSHAGLGAGRQQHLGTVIVHTTTASSGVLYRSLGNGTGGTS
jgi:hypothetical protein